MDQPGVFVKNPIPVQAIQFTGDNWEAVQYFTGERRVADNPSHQHFVFNPIGTFLVKEDYPGAVAELWVEANKQWLPIEVNEWILRDSLGFYPCKNDQFHRSYNFTGWPH